MRRKDKKHSVFHFIMRKKDKNNNVFSLYNDAKKINIQWSLFTLRNTCFTTTCFIFLWKTVIFIWFVWFWEDLYVERNKVEKKSPDSCPHNNARQNLLKGSFEPFTHPHHRGWRKVKANCPFRVTSAFTSQVGQPSLMHCQRSDWHLGIVWVRVPDRQKNFDYNLLPCLILLGDAKTMQTIYIATDEIKKKLKFQGFWKILCSDRFSDNLLPL